MHLLIFINFFMLTITFIIVFIMFVIVYDVDNLTLFWIRNDRCIHAHCN